MGGEGWRADADLSRAVAPTVHLEARKGTTAGSSSSWSAERRFAIWLLLITLAGFGFRFAYVVESRHDILKDDGPGYHALALVLADGQGFINPDPYRHSGEVEQRAVHPPVWSLTLMVPAFLGFRSLAEQQAFATVIGAATIAMVGFAGRRLGGPRVGLVAAGIAAAYPLFWRYERELLSETLVLLGVAAVLFLSYDFWTRPNLGRAVAVGAVCGLLTLTRAELILLGVALLAPLVLLAPAVPWRQRVGWFAIAGVIMAGVVAPWVVYNLARFEEPVLLTHSLGRNLSIANCDFTYSGEQLGHTHGRCVQTREPEVRASLRRTGGDASTRETVERRQGLVYVRDHLARVPVVVFAREGRAWGVFRPFEQMELEARTGTSLWVFQAGFVVHWLLLPAAIIGAVLLRRRNVPLFPLIAFLVIGAIAIALTFGKVRFRAPADVSIVLLAAVAIEAILPRGRTAAGELASRPPEPKEVP